ncbi:MAG: ATP cone domain-containing protein [Planctomycetota bacterium]
MKARKRDGRLDLFDPSKIAAAIHRAARSVGHSESLLAEELASVVTLLLEKDFGEGVVPIQEIQEMVEKVLMETGHTEIARAFLLFRERREKIKEVIQVRESQASENQTKEVQVNGCNTGSITPWSKGRIVKALVTEAELPADMAAEIASEVENKIFKSGLTRVSSSLIRELVDNELFNRGLNRRLLNQSILGIPGYDLRRIVESEDDGRTPADVNQRIAGHVLKQFSLRWIHSPEEAELHLREDARICGLTHPSGYVDFELEPALLPSPFGGPSALPRYLAPCIRFLGQFVSRFVVVNITDAVLHAYTARGISPEHYAEDLLSALATGPVSSRTVMQNPVPGTPIIRISRQLTEKRQSVLKAVNMQGKSAAHFMENQVSAFLDAAVKLSRELSIPHIQFDLGGPRELDEGILSKAVLLDAANRLSLCLLPYAESQCEAIRPVKGCVSLDLTTLLQKMQHISDADFMYEARSVLAMAAAALFSKDQYMRKLHRKSRGPKAAIRRYLGGNDETLGRGTFTIVPAFLLKLESARKNDFGQENGGLIGLGRFTSEVAAQLRGWIVEEAQKSGCRINVVAPWENLSYENYYPGIESIEAAFEKTRAWCGFVPLNPLPDCFKSEAEKRIQYIRMIMEGLAERKNVS